MALNSSSSLDRSNGQDGGDPPPRSLRRKSQKSSYRLRQATAPTRAQESLLLTMQLRKLQRDQNGTQKKATRTHLIALFLLLLVLYGVGSSYYDGGTFTTTITLSLWQMVGIGFWFLVCVIVTSMFADRHFIALLYWMVVYWPLMAILASLLFAGTTGVHQSYDWIWISLIIVEAITLLIFIIIHVVKPNFLKSQYFRNHCVSRFWNVQVISGWTITYGRFGKRYTCKYEGDFDENNLPSGSGRWLDDSHGGEVLTGTWKNGEPVAPFISRRYGTGDAFRAVPIAYFMATDDEFGFNKLVPTNNEPARCGVASVECSVQGAFYNHLPAATELYGPVIVDKDTAVLECFNHMTGTSEEERKGASTLVTVNARDPRGVQVLGHLYEPTGLPFAEHSSRIIIDIEREQNEANPQPEQDSDNFMPFTSFRSAKSELILVHDEKPSEVPTQITINEAIDPEEQHQDKAQDQEETENLIPNRGIPRLHVQNWISSPNKDALVYIPGFNSCLKQSLQTLGQFVAMTKIADHVHPIIFAWPNGQVPTYRHASAISATQTNKQRFLELMHGLSAAGIRHVHFMSHSLGVQTLLGAFGDKSDGTRSDVSQCFRLDSAFDGNNSEEESKLMICKSITMVNPDFPIEAFIDHSFLAIRRVCDHITVVGDRGDQALFYSSFINGSMNFMGYSQPTILNKDGKEKSGKRKGGFQAQRVVGRDIQSLYMPDDVQQDEEGRSACDERLLFEGVTPIIVSPDEQLPDRHWLDVDVIDTTQLDTNIKDLRHSGFNVNPILINDLEELIVTGRRAANRSSLLFREGNIYSYCHAPAFVTM